MTEKQPSRGHAGSVPFASVATSDLLVDTIYRGGGDLAAEPLHSMFRCGVGGGFRYKRDRKTKRLQYVVLFTTGADPDWPDYLDVESGTFIYYGDNRHPGELHATKRRGNEILRDTFARLQDPAPGRKLIPPFFIFTRGPRGHDVVFRGLAAPGGPHIPPLEQLVAVWKTTNGIRFQNYMAVFTILKTGVIPRMWLDDLVEGTLDGSNAPPEWSRWIETGVYEPLRTERTQAHRTPVEQTPLPGLQSRLVAAIVEHFRDDPFGFEQCAAEVFRMMDPNVTSIELTRPWRDGGRDALGRYRIGSRGDGVEVEFALEAKCLSPTSSVGVRQTSRLISRLRHRQFGVLVTTSFVHTQAYREIKEDQHPVLILSGRDIAEILIENGVSTSESVRSWLGALRSNLE